MRARLRLDALALAAVTGCVTGAAVALFEWVTREQLFHRLARASEGVQLVAPVAALLVAALILRWIGGGASPATADEYIHNFHQHDVPLDARPAPARVLASIATLGLGGAMGYEGPSIYIGATLGARLQARLGRFFAASDAKVLLVAGAAAGVAAIFKAPATGLVFALEVPYQEDFARRMLLPAGMAAATSYITFAAFRGTEPLLAVRGTPRFDFHDLAGAVVLGVLCGVGARVFTTGLALSKRMAANFHPLVRALVAGVGLAGLVALSYGAFGSGLTLGAGYDNVTWALDPRRAVGLVLLLFVMRGVATVLTVGGGGAGGLFIPLVIEGALLGRAVSGLFNSAASGSTFFPLIGVAAFLGAGYRVPLAAVVFTAEATGRAAFIVPGIIAAIVAQLFMGTASASQYQVPGRF
ncbi:MAG: chloride channel protein [Actinobacteria bacterium]|nr:chloride channel protein [Actinomycetota bacterium]